MKIVVRELREGSNPIRFPLPGPRLDRIVKDVDELYRAETDGAVNLDVQKLEGMLFLRGKVDANYLFDCATCLAERQRTLEIDIHWTLIPKNAFSDEDSQTEVELTSDDLDTSFYEGEEVDLGELAREAILLELPSIPRCSASEVCTREHDQEPKPSKDTVDPRWGPIKAMLESKNQN